MSNTEAFGWTYMVNWLARREHVIPDIRITKTTRYNKLTKPVKN
jgi:hypothetical protein